MRAEEVEDGCGGGCGGWVGVVLDLGCREGRHMGKMTKGMGFRQAGGKGGVMGSGFSKFFLLLLKI